MKRQTIEVISFLFILLFTYAAIAKLMELEKFRIQIGQSPLLTDIARPVAVIVPVTEILISFLLAIPKLRFIGLLMALNLMVMFTTYVFIIMNFSEYIPCSCGGVLQSLGWQGHLILNLVFVVLGIIGVLVYSNGAARKNYSIKDILLQ